MDSKLIIVALVGIVVGAVAVAAFTLDDEPAAPEEDVGTTDAGLAIFGNANGDYVLDDKDKQVIQDVIDKKVSTNDLPRVRDNENKVYCLADTNLDNKIDAADIAELEKVIDRTAENMNIIDTFGYKLTVPMKIDRIACDYFATAELLQLVGAQEKIVAASHALIVLKDYYLSGMTDTSKVVDFGKRWDPDSERTAEADPQVWVVSEDYAGYISEVSQAVVIGLDTLVFDFEDIDNSSPIKSAMLAGYIFGNVEKAQEYVDWYLEKWNYFHDKTKDLSDSDRPTVFFTGYGQYIKDNTDKNLRYFPAGTVPWQAVELAGGHNIFDDYDGNGVLPAPKRPTTNVNCDFEWIVDQKYDYLFVHCTKYTGKGDVVPYVPTHGYLCDDATEWIAGQKAVAEMEIFKNSVPAENVYLSPGDYMNSASGGILNTAMLAKVMHPDLFSDMEVLDIQQEYVTLMGFDFDVHEKGVFFAEN